MLVAAALMMLTILTVGLAMDCGLLYVIKAKLVTAVDAAALSGARSLSRGQSISSQTASAQSTAQVFFQANFPDGYMFTSNPTVSIDVAESDYRTRTVSVNGSVTAPLFFMRMLGFDSVSVRASGTASRRDVNVMLVLDRSGSLTSAGACDDLRGAAALFVDRFAEGRDRLGMVTYGGSSLVDFAPSMSFKSGTPNLPSLIGAIACNGATGSAQALWQGYQQLAAIGEAGALNVILFFTDGKPNAITAQYPVKKLTTPYSPTGKSTCYDEAGLPNSNPAWNPGPKLGFVTVSYGATPVTNGVRTHIAPPIPVSADPGKISNSTGCYFASSTTQVYKDIAYVPDTDYYGNSVHGYKSVSTYASGPYSGRVRIDSPTTMENAAINALDNAALRIRQDANLKPVIYSIGLGGAGEAEHELLKRVANTLDSPIYDSTQQMGLYIYAPTPAQLGDAFARIASEILRLAI